MIYIERSADTPLYEQIYAALKGEILSGALKPGTKLPATRKMSKELSVGRNTVDKAYQQLVAEGYVDSTIGSGFCVNQIPAELPQSHYDGILSPIESSGKKPQYQYDFAYGSMDNRIFPYTQWKKSINNALASMEAATVMEYPNRQGELVLRQAISYYLQRSRGVVCSPEQVVITCGHQHSMEILANVFRNTEKRFIMEEPGYDGIRTVFQNHDYRLTPLPVENDGVCLSDLHNLRGDLLYLTPSHQFPTGAVLPIAKRRQLLKWASETGCYLIEDDYDSELRYYTNPVPALQSLDQQNRTIYTGTFSKSLSPVMRVAYIVFPHPLMDLYREYYWRYNAQVSVLYQRALADYIQTGNYEKHINRLRTFYRKKQDALMLALQQVFGEQASVSGGDAGIHILLSLKTAYSQEELIALAEDIGIKVYPTKINYIHPENCPRSQLLLGLSTIPENQFVPILTRLAEVWRIYTC